MVATCSKIGWGDHIQGHRCLQATGSPDPSLTSFAVTSRDVSFPPVTELISGRLELPNSTEPWRTSLITFPAKVSVFAEMV